MAIIETPDFNWTGFYYAEILESLVKYKREFVPELSDESKFSVGMQLLSAFALVGHLGSSKAETLANETFLSTAKLTDSVRAHLRLIGYEMRSARPARADVIFQLSGVLTSTKSIVPEGAVVSTESDPPVYFENVDELECEATDAFTAVFAVEAGVWTDVTTLANSPNSPIDDFTPWATPAVGDALYFCHSEAMYDLLKIYVTTAGSGFTGFFEYYNGDLLRAAPTSMQHIGNTLVFNVNGYVGTQNATGLIVRVTLNSSTAWEEAAVAWDGANNTVTVGLLGQVNPSLATRDYTVGSLWERLRPSLSITTDLEFGFELPQTLTKNWRKSTIENVTGRWARYRIVEVAAPSPVTIDHMTLDEGSQYVLSVVKQGRTQIDNPLGNGDGTPSQRFQTSQDGFIDGTAEISVDGLIWSPVDNFVNTNAGDQVYRIELGTNDKATVVFAPSGQGAAPPPGIGNVAAAYMWGADLDGNVGAETIVIDGNGLSNVNRLWNPRAAVGWSEAQGASLDSLEKAKQLGPASLRTLGGVANSPDDVINLCLNFTSEDGFSPISRAFAVEEMFGPKTIGVVAVAPGGGIIPTELITEIQVYFNGDKFAIPAKPKHITANQEVTVVNFTPVPISVTATVTAPSTVTAQQIKNALESFLHPEAKIEAEDGLDSYLWSFGGSIVSSQIIHLIHAVNPAQIKSVVLIGWGDVTLPTTGLPTIGTLTIDVVSP